MGRPDGGVNNLDDENVRYRTEAFDVAARGRTCATA
jgi:hypothetical protein